MPAPRANLALMSYISGKRIGRGATTARRRRDRTSGVWRSIQLRPGLGHLGRSHA